MAERKTYPEGQILPKYTVYLRGRVRRKPDEFDDREYNTVTARHKVEAKTRKQAVDAAMLLHEKGRWPWREDGKEILGPVYVEQATVDFDDILDLVLTHYLARTPSARLQKTFDLARTKQPQGTYFGYQLRRDGHMAPQGTRRISYDDAGRLWSYNMLLAQRTTGPDGELLILVNGDGAPTPATGQHMRALWDKLRKMPPRAVRMSKPPNILVPHAFIPFSVLAQARIDVRDVEVPATTPDRVEKRKVPRKPTPENARDWTWSYDHYLGEALFAARGRVFVCGLDRNDPGRNRMFFMCQIPAGTRRPRSVDEALRRLRPKGLPSDALRQGEWFFVPKPNYRPDFKDPNVHKGLRVPIVSQEVDEQLRALEQKTQGLRLARDGRHVASTLMVDGAVYAKGVVTDDEHARLTLGPVWHKVVKNLAVEGWRYEAKNGVRVD